MGEGKGIRERCTHDCGRKHQVSVCDMRGEKRLILSKEPVEPPANSESHTVFRFYVVLKVVTLLRSGV